MEACASSASFGSLVAIPAVGDKIKPVIDDLRLKLNGMVTA
jgi:hypothetical protein